MKIKYLALLFTLLLSTVAFGQMGTRTIDENSDWKDRLYFGGGLGLSAGSGYTMISVSPIVGYMITNRLSGGIGVTYQYYKSGDFTDNRYGGQLFMRVNVIKQIFAYGSYEFMNYGTYTITGDEGPRNTVSRLPLGLGLSQPIGNRSSVNFLAAYDVLYDDQLGAYNSPWIFTVYFSL